MRKKLIYKILISVLQTSQINYKHTVKTGNLKMLDTNGPLN